MKIFLLFLLSLFPLSSFAATCAFYVVGSPQNTWPSAQDLCTPKLNSSNIASFSGGTWKCSKTSHVIATTGDCSGSCVAGATYVYSGSVTIQNWSDDSEYLDLTEKAAQKFSGTSICASSCIHSYDFLGDGEGDLEKGPITFSGRYTSTTQACTSPTSGPTATFSGTATGGDTGGDTGGNTGGNTGGSSDLGDLKVTIINKSDEIISTINSGIGSIANSFTSLKDLISDRISLITNYQHEELYETRENGKTLQRIEEKLGGAASEPEDTSGLKDWLTEDFDDSTPTDVVPEKELTAQSFKTDLFVSSSQCPSDRTLTLPLFPGKSFSKTFSFEIWCDKLAIFGHIILLFSYLYGALIITRNS